MGSAEPPGTLAAASRSASMGQWREGILSSPHLPSLPVHPAQLYESLGALVVLALVLAARNRRRVPGEAFLTFGVGYGALRFALEFLRANQGLEDLTRALNGLDNMRTTVP